MIVNGLSPVVAALSGPGGSYLRLFDFLSGQLLSEQRLHSPEAGRLFEPAFLGVDITFGDRIAVEQNQSSKNDVFVLTNGHIIRCIDTGTGKAKWDWIAPDQK